MRGERPDTSLAIGLAWRALCLIVAGALLGAIAGIGGLRFAPDEAAVVTFGSRIFRMLPWVQGAVLLPLGLTPWAHGQTPGPPPLWRGACAWVLVACVGSLGGALCFMIAAMQPSNILGGTDPETLVRAYRAAVGWQGLVRLTGIPCLAGLLAACLQWFRGDRVR